MVSQSPSGENPLDTGSPRTRQKLPLWLLTLTAGLVAGALSWLGGEFTHKAFPVTIVIPPEVAKMPPRDVARSAKINQLLVAATKVVEQKKTVVAYGLLGALLGAAVGMIGGWSRGSSQSGWRGALGGGLSAAVVGASLSWVLVPLMFGFQAAAQEADPDFSARFLLIHCLVHAAIGAGIGVSVGLALGWGLGDRASLGRALIGGLFGGLAGVFLFEAINSIAFPMMRAETPLPEERLARLAMYLGVAGGAAFLAGLAADSPPRRSSSASPAS